MKDYERSVAVRSKTLPQLIFQNGYLERTMPVDYEARPRKPEQHEAPARDIERVVEHIKQRHLNEAARQFWR